ERRLAHGGQTRSLAGNLLQQDERAQPLTARSGVVSRAVSSLQQRLDAPMKSRTVYALSSLLLIAISSIASAQNANPPLVSPDVQPDRRVTFRFRDPNAKEVAVQMEGVAKPIPMKRDEQGVWSVTTDPLTPDYYGYSFQADGVSLLDPSNYRVKPNFLYRAN